MELEAGELDRRITLTQKSAKDDGYGKNTIGGTNEIGTFWASLKAITQRNVVVAKGYAPTVNYESKLRYRPEANTHCMATIDGDVFAVNGVLHDPYKLWTQLFLTRQMI